MSQKQQEKVHFRLHFGILINSTTVYSLGGFNFTPHSTIIKICWINKNPNQLLFDNDTYKRKNTYFDLLSHLTLSKKYKFLRHSTLSKNTSRS